MKLADCRCLDTYFLPLFLYFLHVPTDIHVLFAFLKIITIRLSDEPYIVLKHDLANLRILQQVRGLTCDDCKVKVSTFEFISIFDNCVENRCR